MVKTPEGYLICKNVPIGRVGTMDYLGSELPQEFNLPANDIFHVFRTADSLFSKETIASFEGKPITDNHPTNNLTVDTASIIGRGHLQNVHPEGKNLVGDLYITDNGLINQIENNNKREVSCGYDAGWRMNEDGKIEQIDIVGNHVAVVNSGRAGHSVAIKDSSPEIKKNIGGKKMTITKKMLTALGLKHFAADAEPEEIAKAMDAMGGEEAPQKTTVTKDDDMAVQNKDPEQKVDPLVEVNAKIDKLASIISALVESDKKVHEEAGAKEAFDELEGELSEPEDEETLKDEEEETPEMQEEEKNTGEEKHEFVADEEAVKKIVKDMKPIIMNIKDKIVRDAVAKEFVKTVRDSRPSTGRNGYSQIIKNANASRKVAQDKATMPAVGNLYKATDAATAWANYGKTLSKGDK
jgi:hypothetical protein